MTDSLGQSQVLPYLLGLSQKGYKISLISCEKSDKFNLHKATIAQICKESSIDWHPLNYTKKPPLLSTIWDLQKINKKAKALHRKQQFEIVHCRSYIAAMAGLKLKKKYGVNMLFDMRGFWADERIDGNIWSLSNPIFKIVYNFFKKKEKQFFIQSDHVISLTENGKQEILSWNLPSVTTEKITVIPCCVDLELFNPSKNTELQQSEIKSVLGINETDFILGYVGSIGTWYMLSEMLDYFKILKKNNSTAKFLFVSGENSDTILSKVTEKGINPSDIIIKSCLHKEVPLYISLFDESIFFIRPTYSKKASSPTKQGEIMAMGIPLICNAGVGDTDAIVYKYESGIVLKELNETSYKNAINEGILFNQEKTKEGASEFFSLKNGVEKYASVYKRI